MTTEDNRHKKQSGMYDVLFVPIDQALRTKKLRVSRLRLWMAGGGLFFLIVAFTLAVLIYTPLALYVPIPNPELERKYGKEIIETQRRLKGLADDVLLLRDYNLQLRKALGEGGKSDSSVSSRTLANQVPYPPELTSRIDNTDVVEGADTLSLDEGDYEVGSSQYNAVVTSNEGLHAAFPLLAPTEGFASQGFDPSRRHFGIDYAAKRGTAVFAASDGYVLFAGWTYDDGNMLMVAHGNGYVTVYKHNQVLMKGAHAFVRRGEVVALLGVSGKTSTGPHLHFEVWKDGVPQDPNEFLLVPAKIQ